MRIRYASEQEISYDVWADSGDCFNKTVVLRENGNDLGTAGVADVADIVVCCQL